MNDLTTRNEGAMTVADMANQVSQIQALMKQVMKPDVHYGTIPGTDKNALFKAGAEKIGLMFGCRTSYDIRRDDLDDGHREYEVTCHITDRSGNHIGSGLGACTTMEKKYRYRSEFTNRPVPPEYWETRDQAILGGRDFTPRKVQGKWQIVQQVEYDNPADYYNTVLKMAKKRAFVDAILTCTAASDFFDQEEVLDTPELYPDAAPSEPPTDAPRRQPKAKQAEGVVNAGQLKVVRKKAESKGITDGMICEEFRVDNIENLPAAQVNNVLEWLDNVSN